MKGSIGRLCKTLGLADGTHTFLVVATDTAGKVDPVGASYSWTVSTAALTISNFNVSNVTSSTALITWDTNLPSSTQGFYAMFPSMVYSSTTLDNTQVTSHSVTLTGLTPGVLQRLRTINRRWSASPRLCGELQNSKNTLEAILSMPSGARLDRYYGAGHRIDLKLCQRRVPALEHFRARADSGRRESAGRRIPRSNDEAVSQLKV
jgi:hypothetical protein